MSRVLEGEELQALSYVIESARRAGSNSTCKKDHRGAVVFRDGEVLGEAHNGPLPRLNCEMEKCFNVCGLFAMHAERLAIIDALEKHHDLNGSSVLHVKLNDDDEIQISGKLRCEDCTGFMMRFLRKGIMLKEFILLQESGWTAYRIEEADLATRKNLGLV